MIFLEYFSTFPHFTVQRYLGRNVIFLYLDRSPDVAEILHSLLNKKDKQVKTNQSMSSVGGTRSPLLFFVPGNLGNITSTNLVFVTLLSLIVGSERSSFEVWELISLCLAMQHLNVFHAFVSVFTCACRGMHEYVWGSKCSHPFPTEHSLPGASYTGLKARLGLEGACILLSKYL